jgi:type II secretory ATPase GspE/PulE/Tfp pilus assembly ATPase PilB-like protein
MVIDEMIQEMILKSESAYEIAKAAQKSGKFRSLKESVAEKIRQGVTTVEEAASVVVM